MTQNLTDLYYGSRNSCLFSKILSEPFALFASSRLIQTQFHREVAKRAKNREGSERVPERELDVAAVLGAGDPRPRNSVEEIVATRTEQVRMVEQVERFGPELQRLPFGDVDVLLEPEVDVVCVRARDDVRTRVAMDVDGPRVPGHGVREGGRDVAREAGVVIPVVGGTLVARQDAAADAVRELEARCVD